MGAKFTKSPELVSLATTITELKGLSRDTLSDSARVFNLPFPSTFSYHPASRFSVVCILSLQART
jgi:hypothetical protein